MRFQLTHKLTTYLLVLSSLATLSAANRLDGGVAALAVGLGVMSWFVDPDTRWFRWLERAKPLVRLLAGAFFAVTAYRVWRHLPDPDLTPVLDLLVFLTVCKLFQRAANRDYAQISGLGFLMVVAGAAFAQSFVFIPAFVAYVLLTTWTLILLHLRREIEDNYLVKHTEHAPSHRVGVARVLNSRRVIGPPFLGATAAVALAIVVGAAVTFAVVPRVGAGFALGGQRARRTLIGFSDEVKLGTSGALSDENDTVALRAVLPRLERLEGDRARDAEIDQLYWRGTVYDRYDKGRWQRSQTEALRTHLLERGGPTLIREPHLGPPAHESPGPQSNGAEATHATALAAAGEPTVELADTERQEIDIVGVSAPVAFALDHPVAFELPAPRFGALSELRLIPRWSGEVGFRSAVDEIADADGSTDTTEGAVGGSVDLRSFAGARYVAYSRDPTRSGRVIRTGRSLAQVPPAVLGPYLALPATLAGELEPLGKSITAGRTTAIAKVIAITTWLQATHGYSTSLERGEDAAQASDGRDPVTEFLFARKSGHCEFFASAAALLLRSVGVPTRYVNGFLGGEWNSVGRYVAVRQNRAHAWTEAYLGELGWMRVDATPPPPPTPPVTSGARPGSVRQLFDSVDFLWGRWVVGYDLSRQIGIARQVGRGFGLGQERRRADGPDAGSGIVATVKAMARSPYGAAAGCLSAALGVWLLERYRRRRHAEREVRTAPGGRSASLAQAGIARLYRRCEDRLRRRGHRRLEGETAREFAARIAREIPVSGPSTFSQITELYLGVRFGREEVNPEVVTALAGRLAREAWFRSSLGGAPPRSPVA